jgi:hypothetical protein
LYSACNIDKGNKDIKEFLKRSRKRLKKIQAQAKAPLKDAAAVNATRYATGNALKSFGLPITFSSGGRTKFNRLKLGYKKDHWIDAACFRGKSFCAQKLLPRKVIVLATLLFPKR